MSMHVTGNETLSLENIAARLASLEETLIYKLLDRSQFRRNRGVYEPGKSQFLPPEPVSLFELRLLHQEKLDAVFGRYLIPEERPFYTGLPQPRRHLGSTQGQLRISDYDVINVSGSILSAYSRFLDSLCVAGDDAQWGSSVEHDVICLQALGRRIHFGGLYVAESKFLENPEKYSVLIRERDEAGLEEALTRPEVEKKVLDRVRLKVQAIQSISDPSLRVLVDPELVVGFFAQAIIPLTKDSEVRYLLQRSLR